MSKAEHIVNYRKRIKIALVEAFGNKCQICGNSFPHFIYDFHHINPDEKDFGLGNAATTRAKAAYAEEAKKCAMLCANCHRVVEYQGAEKELICDFNEEVYFHTLDVLVNGEPVPESPKPIASMKPDREQLKKDIRSMTMVAVGSKYKVTDNAVRKWCKTYNLPFRVTDIKQISDEEWENI